MKIKRKVCMTCNCQQKNLLVTSGEFITRRLSSVSKAEEKSWGPQI